MGLFASAQFHLDAHLIAISQKLFDLPGAHLEVMRAGLESDANSFELNLFLLFAVLAFSLFFFVLELAEVHDLADRRLRGSRDLDQVEPALVCDAQRLRGFEYAEILSLVVNNADRRGADILIYAVALLDGGFGAYIIKI